MDGSLSNPKRPRIGHFSPSISNTTTNVGSNSATYLFTGADRVILNDYSYAAYDIAPGNFKRALEPVLLMGIVHSSNHELNDDYLSWDKCSSLLQSDLSFRDLLLGCWKDGSFKLVRESGE